MTNIKTYKDGNRLILVLENCTGETAIKANRFILDVLGMPDTMQDMVESEPIPAVVPEPVEEDVIQPEKCEPITEEKPFAEPIPLQAANNVAVTGGSGTLGKAIENKDTAAIVDLCLHSKTMSDTTRTSVMTLCKDYIRKDCERRDPDYASAVEIRKFFEIYDPLIKNGIKQILESSGYATVDDFFDLTDETLQQDAYSAILDMLIRRVSD